MATSKKSPLKMGNPEAIASAKKNFSKSQKNADIKKYNAAKESIRNVNSAKNTSAAQKAQILARSKNLVSGMEKKDLKTYKSLPAKTSAKPAAKPVAKPATPAGNGYAKANKGGEMDKLVKLRNSASKGSREYADAQNKINAALGSKVRHTAKK
jgi:hypothetical protein